MEGGGVPLARVVDERVVKMTFEAKQFQNGVNDTIDSLDKFQKKLDGMEAGKQFDDISKSAKNVDLGTLESNVDKVAVKFDAMAVVAMSALDRLTNKVIDTGTSMVKSLSIDQVSAGFDKYTEKTSAVATIMSATGKSIDEVSNALSKLQWFTDETSYDFSDMVNNIAKFTNSKVPLDQAIDSIMGVALVAADAGANANEASRAMYNFSQAIGAGKVQLIDWKSIDLANMGTAKFKETIMETAAELGTLVKTTEGYKTAAKGTAVSVASFNQTLSEGWFTSNVLIDSLGKFSNYANKIYDVKDSFDTCADAMAATSAEGMELGEVAFKAGQQSKTFLDAINATKDAVSSGWMQTFDIVFGNYEECVELWSSLTGYLWDIFASGFEERNAVLNAALSSGWKQMTEEFQVDFGTMEDTMKSMIGETDRWKQAMEQVGPNGTFQNILETGLITLDDLKGTINAVCNEYDSLSDAQKENGKYTTKQWVEYKNLQTKIEAGAISLDEFYEKLTRMSGRDNIFTGLANLFRALTEVIQPFKDAISELFPPATAEEIYRITEKFREFAESLKLSEEAAYTLKVVFKVILTPIKMVVTLVSAGVQIFGTLIVAIWKIADALLAIPSMTNPVAAALRKLFGDERYNQVLDAMHQLLGNVVNAFKQLGSVLAGISLDILNGIGSALRQIGQWLAPIVDRGLDLFVAGLQKLASLDFGSVFTIAGNAIRNLGDGIEFVVDLLSGGIDKVWEFVSAIDFSAPLKIIRDFATQVKDMISQVPIFNADSSIFSSIGTFVDRIKDAAKAVFDFVAELGPGRIAILIFGTAILQTILSVNKLVNSISGIVDASTGVVKEFSNTVKAFNDVLSSFKDIGESVSGVFKSVSKAIDKASGASRFQQTIREIAISITILAGALALLSQIDPERLKNGGIAMAALAGGIMVLGTAMALIQKFLLKSEAMSKGFRAMGVGLLAMAAAVAVLAGSLVLLTNMNLHDLGEGLLSLTLILAELTAAAVVMSANSVTFGKGSLFLISFASSIGILVLSLQSLANADMRGIERNIGSLAVVIGMMVALSVATSNMRFGSGIGMMVAILDILVMINIANKLADVDTQRLIDAIPNYLIVIGMISGLMLATQLASTNAAKAGAALVLITVAITMISRVIDDFGELSGSVATQGTIIIGILMTFFAGLMLLMGNISKNVGKMGTAFFMLGSAILVLSVAIDYIGSLSIREVVVGTAAVAALMAMFALIEFAAKDVNASAKTILAITGCLMLLSVAVGVLSMIPAQELLPAAVALSAVIAAFGLAVHQINSGNLSRSSLIKAIANAGLMAAFMAAITGIMIYTQDMNTTGMLKVATGIAEVILAVGASIKLMNSNNLTPSTWTQVLQNMAYIGTFLTAGTAVAAIISVLPPTEGLLTKATAISEVVLAAAAAVFIINNKLTSVSSVQDAISKVIEITAFLGIATGAVAGLSYIPATEGLLTKATAVSEVILASAAAVLIINNKFASVATIQDAVAKMIEIISFVGIATGGLIGMSMFTDAEGIIAKATALSEVILATSLAVLLINNRFSSTTIISDAVSKLIEMIGFVGTAATGLAIFSYFTDAEGLIEKATALSEVMLALSAAVSIVANFVTVSSIQQAITNAVGMIAYGGVLMALTTAFGLVLGSEAFDGFYTKKDVWNATLLAMLEILGTCMAVALASTVIGAIPTDLIAKGGVVLGAIAGVIAAITLVLGAVEEMTGGGFSSLLDSGGQVLISLGGAIGGFIGGIVGGIQSGIEITKAKQLQDLAPILSNFATEIEPFCNMADMFTEDLVQQVTNMIDICNTLGNFVPNVDDYSTWESFGEAMEGFAPFVAGFVETIQDAGLSADLVSATSALVDSLLKLNDAIGPIGAITGVFQDMAMDNFVDRIKTFGQGMAEFMKTIEGCDTTQAQAVIAVADSLMNLESATDAMGGVVDFFVGSKDLGAFGTRISQFGSGMAGFFAHLKVIEELGVSQDTVDASYKVGETLIALEDSVTRKGGFIQWIMGQSDIGTFGTNIRTFGSGLADFITSVSEAVSTHGTDFADAALKIGEGLSALEGTLDNHGGLSGLIFGSSDLGAFGESIKTFAEGLSNFADSVARFSGQELTGALDTMRNAGKDMATAFDGGVKVGLTPAMQDEGKYAVTEAIGGVSSQLNLSKRDIENLAKKIPSYFTSGIGTQMLNVGEQCIRDLKQGIENEKQGLYTNVRNVGNGMVSALRQSLDSNSPSKKFYEVGVDIVRGLKGGVDDDTERSAAFESIRRLGRGIINAAKDELDINSPSRIARDEVGHMIVEGIAYGITEDMTAEEAAKKKAENIISAFKDEISKMDLRNQAWDLANDFNETLYHSFDDQELDPAKLFQNKQDKSLREIATLQQKASTSIENSTMYQTAKALTEEYYPEQKDAIQELDNLILQEQKNLADYAKQVAELQRGMNQNIQDNLKDQALENRLAHEEKTQQHAWDLEDTLYHSFDNEDDIQAKYEKSQREVKRLEEQANNEINTMLRTQKELLAMQTYYPEEQEKIYGLQEQIMESEKSIAGYAKDIATLNREMNETLSNGSELQWDKLKAFDQAQRDNADWIEEMVAQGFDRDRVLDQLAREVGFDREHFNPATGMNDLGMDMEQQLDTDPAALYDKWMGQFNEQAKDLETVIELYKDTDPAEIFKRWNIQIQQIDASIAEDLENTKKAISSGSSSGSGGGGKKGKSSAADAGLDLGGYSGADVKVPDLLSLDDVKEQIFGKGDSEGNKFGDTFMGFINNLVDGFNLGFSDIINKGTEIFNKFLEKGMSIFAVESPSKVFYWIGQMITAGLINGINDGTGDVDSAMENAFIGPTSDIAGVSEDALNSVVNWFADDGKAFTDISYEAVSAITNGFQDNVDALGNSFINGLEDAANDSKDKSAPTYKKEGNSLGSTVISSIASAFTDGGTTLGSSLSTIVKNAVEAAKKTATSTANSGSITSSRVPSTGGGRGVGIGDLNRGNMTSKMADSIDAYIAQKNKEKADKESSSKNSGSNTTVNFQQNITSPKATSNSEIYRQTKSALGGLSSSTSSLSKTKSTSSTSKTNSYTGSTSSHSSHQFF